MPTIRLLLFVSVTAVLALGQKLSDRAAPQEPSLPAIDENACPFEGCSFGKWIVARDSSISEGRKDWWVRLKTAQGSVGWAKAEGQFDCMDALGGDPKCDKL